MAHCLQLAQLGQYYVAPNPMVGAVLVDDGGCIIGEGWHREYGKAHAEVNCLMDAETRATLPIDYPSCTLYVSLEPCSHYGKTPPCAKLIIEKHIGKVVVGMSDPNPLVAGRGITMLRSAGIEVEVGVLEAQCRWLNRRFLCLQTQHRPYVILKWAQTADGYLDVQRTLTQAAEGPLMISSQLTKQIVHRLRAENMAILVGKRTALLDNPKLLTTRWSGRNPIRILLDRHQQVCKDNNIFSADAQTIVYSDNTDWKYVLSDMAERGIHSVVVEGGAQVLQSVLDSGIYDEIHIEVSPNTLVVGQKGVLAPAVVLPDKPAKVLYQHRLYEIINNNL